MQITTSIEELMQLQQSVSAKDIEIAVLRKELEQLRMQTGDGGNVQTDTNFLSIKLENVCKVLHELKGSPNLVSFFFLCLLKMMPEGMPVCAVQRMLAAASLETLPLNLTAKGDIRIEGNYNDVKGNGSVNF